jgi:hypothetical protein
VPARVIRSCRPGVQRGTDGRKLGAAGRRRRSAGLPDICLQEPGPASTAPIRAGGHAGASRPARCEVAAAVGSRAGADAQASAMGMTGGCLLPARSAESGHLCPPFGHRKRWRPEPAPTTLATVEWVAPGTEMSARRNSVNGGAGSTRASRSSRLGPGGSALRAADEPQFAPETCLPILTSQDLTARRRTGPNRPVFRAQPGRAPSPALPESHCPGLATGPGKQNDSRPDGQARSNAPACHRPPDEAARHLRVGWKVVKAGALAEGPAPKPTSKCSEGWHPAGGMMAGTVKG